MTFLTWMQANIVYPKEAPAGYYPVKKASVDNGQNFCRHCDWRKDCSKAICSCAAHDRKDGISVVFKRQSATKGDNE